MANAQKRVQDRFCNCKNSKCMKLYCQCFAARIPCTKSCRCIDCQNISARDSYSQNRQDLVRMHKGCACRKSNCNKKYCECFQSGILCKDTCKCVDCQNNESLTNRKIINRLRKNNSQISNTENSINLYPLYISQNPDHLRSIISQSNPLNLEQSWLQKSAKLLYTTATKGHESEVIDKFLQILSQLQSDIAQKVSKIEEDQNMQMYDQNCHFDFVCQQQQSESKGKINQANQEMNSFQEMRKHQQGQQIENRNMVNKIGVQKRWQQLRGNICISQQRSLQKENIKIPQADINLRQQKIGQDGDQNNNQHR